MCCQSSTQRLRRQTEKRAVTSSYRRQGALRVAASLGGERFTKADLVAATSRSTGALSQSLFAS